MRMDQVKYWKDNDNAYYIAAEYTQIQIQIQKYNNQMKYYWNIIVNHEKEVFQLGP